MARVELRDVSKSFGGTAVLRRCNLVAEDGELLVLVGGSGCGKSTILRLIAGLETPDEGEILIDGRSVNGVPPMHRDIAMVFQDYALYPHMTVEENLSFGLRMRKLAAPAIRARVAEVSGLLDIAHLLSRRPRELSGGQRQRVAMGRALVREPSAFLLDEPLSNLDAQLRSQVRLEIRRLHDRLRTTMIHVTHDQIEAMTLADRLVVLRDGIVEQSGTPREVYDRPRSVFVGGFIGSPPMNFIPCTVLREQGAAWLALPEGPRLALPPRRPELEPSTHQALMHGGAVILGLRPEAIGLRPLAMSPDGGGMTATVTMVEPLGAETLYTLDLSGTAVVARAPPTPVFRRDVRVSASLDMAQAHLFDPTTGEAL